MMYTKYRAGTAYDEFECEIFNRKGENVGNPEAWKVRPCEWYREEVKYCKKFTTKFHHKWLGVPHDCSQWVEDLHNCFEFRKTGAKDALEKVIASENKRIEERLKASSANDVWERRTSPPPDWNKPMPDWWTEKVKDSHLQVYMEKERGKERKLKETLGKGLNTFLDRLNPKDPWI
ncbi:synaptic plasticity regulator PANTS [Brevipalpus obovatus]|uniref:synaptic plasticity regulator PANTS n=1 Tax=Brevipalpus obovatus TaxID=246614 RepID=UPI003D9E431E